MRLYLDICAIQRPLDDQTQLRVRAEAEAVVGLLALCENGTLELVVSGVHVVENQKCPHPDRRAHTDDVLGLSRCTELCLDYA
ncbi:MAG: PIN domain-containing protein, partial [Rhodothermales bacterium]